VPRYFFHIFDDLDVSDDEGSQFADLKTARVFGVQNARALMCEALRVEGRINLNHRIDIEDEQGRVVGRVHFADAVTIKR
jgi:hypothetical protein